MFFISSLLNPILIVICYQARSYNVNAQEFYVAVLQTENMNVVALISS